MRSVGINEMTLKLLGVEISDKKIPMMTPQFNGIDSMTTKTAPAMSEEAYEEAIRNQAKKDFEAGKCGGENNTAYRALKNSYVSVASPDRKGYIAKSFQKVPMNKRNQISYMQIKNASGQEIANYSPNTGWTGVMTKDEIIEFEVSGEKIEAVHMLPGYTHNIINLSETENLVTVMWANEQFDPKRPDTFGEKV